MGNFEKVKRPFALVIGIIAAATLVLQFAISTLASLENGEPWYQGTWNLIGYFTIWSNSLIAGFMLHTGLRNPKNDSKFQSRATFVSTQILIVGLIYHFMLRHLWNNQGLFLVADNSLHILIPILTIVFWLCCVRKNQLTYLHPLQWLWFLSIYGVYAFVRGGLTGKYAYPFIDLNQISIARALVTSLILATVFYLIGASLVLIGKILDRP